MSYLCPDRRSTKHVDRTGASMKSLTTCVGSYSTGDALADAVMSYSLALARLRRLDLVNIPFRAANGELSSAEFTIGWMAHVDAVNLGHLHPELTDLAVTAELRARQDALVPDGNTEMEWDDFRAIDGVEDY
jgi:hypothetical protein